MTEKAELKYMVGTGGAADYLVVAVRNNVALGIKPVLAPMSGHGTAFCLRVRSAPFGGAQQLTGNALSKAWPDINFEKMPDEMSTRCSTMVAQLISSTIFEAGTLFAAASKLRVPSKLCDWVQRRVQEEFAVVDHAAMKAFIVEGFKKECEKFPLAIGEPKLLGIATSLAETVQAIKSGEIVTDHKDKAKKPKPKFGVIAGGLGNHTGLAAALIQKMADEEEKKAGHLKAVGEDEQPEDPLADMIPTDEDPPVVAGDLTPEYEEDTALEVEPDDGTDGSDFDPAPPADEPDDETTNA